MRGVYTRLNCDKVYLYGDTTQHLTLSIQVGRVAARQVAIDADDNGLKSGAIPALVEQN